MAQGSPEIVAALIEDLEEEMRAIIQYVWMCVAGKGFNAPAITPQFLAFSKAEMQHAEALAERIDYYGVALPTGPWGVKLYSSLEDMIRAALALEQRTVARYRAHIGLAARLGDPGTRAMLEGILQAEEEHVHYWETALG